MNEEELVLKISSILDERGFTKTESATNRVNAKIGKMSDLAKTAAKAMVGVGVAGASAFLAIAAKGVGINAQLETYNAQLHTLMGTEEAAAKRIKELKDFSASTPFQLDEIVQAEKVMIGFGLQNKKVIQESKNGFDGFRTLIGDVAAGTGVSFDEMAVTMGKFSVGETGTAIARLQELGIATKEEMQGMGIEFSKSGQLLSPLDEAMAVTMELMESKFGGGMERSSATFAGMTSTMKDKLLLLTAAATKPIFDMAKESLDKFLGVLDRIAPVIDVFSNNMADGQGPVEALSNAIAESEFSEYADKLDDAVEAIQPMVEAAKSLGKAIVEIATTYGPPMVAFLLESVIPALTTAGNFIAEHTEIVLLAAGAFGVFKLAMAVGKAVGAAKAAIGGMKAVWAVYKTGTLSASAVTNGFGLALKLALGPIGWIVLAIGLLAIAWKKDLGGIQGHVKTFWEFIKSLPQKIGDAFNKLKEKWQNMSDDTKKKINAVLFLLFPIPMLFTKAGRDIVQGLWDGLKQIWGKMKQWFIDKLADLPEGVKKFFGIASPSRLMIWMGTMIMQGLAWGISFGGKLAVTAMRDAQDALAAEMTSGRLERAQAVVADLGLRITGLRMSFLTGGEEEEGSAAWLLRTWADAEGTLPDLSGMFASLNIPVSDIGQFSDHIAGLIDSGNIEQATTLWNRFYDGLIARQEEVHAANIAGIEADRDAQVKAADEAKRRIEALQDRLGPDSGDISGLSPEIQRVQDTFKELLATLGHEGSTALQDFYEEWTGFAVNGIHSSDELLEAIDALIEKQNELSDAAVGGAEANHQTTMGYLQARLATLDILLQDQAAGEEVVNGIIAERQMLVDAVTAAIKKQQAAQEAYENSVHETAMGLLADYRDAQEDAHNAVLEELQEQRDAITDGFKRQKTEIDHMKFTLADLKMDLNLDAETLKLKGLQDELAKMKSEVAALRIMDVDPIGDKTAATRKKRQSIELDTEAQREMIRNAMASGELDERQMFIAERLLLGHKFNADEVLAIFKVVTDNGAEQVDTQQKIVDAKQAEIDAYVELIAHAEHKLATEQDAAVEILAGLDARIQMENDRWADEKARIDQMMEAEKERHLERMGNIAAEWALELAKLGNTDEEIAAIIAAAAEMAAQVAAEAEEIYRKLTEAIEATVVDMPPLELPPIVYPPTPPGTPPPGFPPGPPGTDSDAEFNVDVAQVNEATIKEISLGDVTVIIENANLELPSGRELALDIVDVIVNDIEITDKLGNRLNERSAERGGI